ncbi:M20 family metallopeptidase [Microbacterium sp. 179-I 3D4 NHS]|uniref:M20 family metallopeptidase n=1 Tax=Microbacterium sp. 179-I 3D4 NHS TaxID=3142381 RepID=UPI0039A1E1B4
MTENSTVDVATAIDAAVAARQDEALALLSRLVATQSVNPLQPGIDGEQYLGGEAAANAVVDEALRELGLETEKVAVDERRPNVVGIRRGTGGGRSLAFNAHIDTVAPQSDTAWKPEVRDGRLYGLGATDMKGGHAAVWLALAAIEDLGVRLSGDVHVHSVVGEETMSHELGTTAVLRAGHRTDAVVVAEPTSSAEVPGRIFNSAAGNYLFAVTLTGRSTHWVNRPRAIRAGGEGDTIGVNAADKAVYIYQAMRQLEEQWAFSKSHPAFPPGSFIIHPGVLRADVGFPAAPYFPDRARIDYLLSFPPGERAEDVRAEVEQHIRLACAMDPWLREHPVEFEWIDTWPPSYSAPDSEFVQAALRARQGVSESDPGVPAVPGVETGSYQSDSAFYEAQGVPAIVCGPGDITCAHAPEEWVDVDAVALLARTYARLILEWCA